MPDKPLEPFSPDCTYMTRETPKFTTHIKRTTVGEFQRNDWLTFSNLESEQFQSGIYKENENLSDREPRRGACRGDH